MDNRCACGCGGLLDFTTGRSVKRFIHGHNAGGTRISPEKREKLLAARKDRWTSDEIEILRTNYAALFIDELMTLLPRHPKFGIFMKANKLGLSKAGDASLPTNEKIRRALKGRITGSRNPHWRSTPLEPGEMARRNREKRARNPTLYRAIDQRSAATRRARKLAVDYGPVSYDAVLARDEWVCGICGGLVSPADLAFDHIMPLARGGPHAEENLQVTHKRCNSRKGASIPTSHPRLPLGAIVVRPLRVKQLPRGESHHGAKLTDATVLEIRTRHAAGDVTQAHLAREFKVSPNLISDVIKRRIWTHL